MSGGQILGFGIKFLKPSLILSILFFASSIVLISFSSFELDLDKWYSSNVCEIWIYLELHRDNVLVEKDFYETDFGYINIYFVGSYIEILVGLNLLAIYKFIDADKILDIYHKIGFTIYFTFYKFVLNATGFGMVSNDSFGRELVENLIQVNYIGLTENLSTINKYSYNYYNQYIVGGYEFFLYQAWLKKVSGLGRLENYFYGVDIVLNRSAANILFDSFNISYIEFMIDGSQIFSYKVFAKMVNLAHQGAVFVFLGLIFLLISYSSNETVKRKKFLILMVIGFIIALIGDIVYTYAWYKISYMPVSWYISSWPPEHLGSDYDEMIYGVTLPPIPFWSPGPWWNWFNKYALPILKQKPSYKTKVIVVEANPELGYTIDRINSVFMLSYMSFIIFVAGILIAIFGYAASKVDKLIKIEWPKQKIE